MTATLTPSRTAARPARGGFAQLLHAEWTKFRTVRGWVASSVGAVLVICLVGLLATAAGNQSGPEGTSALPVGPGGRPSTTASTSCTSRSRATAPSRSPCRR